MACALALLECPPLDKDLDFFGAALFDASGAEVDMEHRCTKQCTDAHNGAGARRTFLHAKCSMVNLWWLGWLSHVLVYLASSWNLYWLRLVWTICFWALKRGFESAVLCQQCMGRRGPASGIGNTTRLL